MLAMSAVAFAGPMVSPYFEIENVGITAAPTLEMGALLEADIADSWTMDLGAFYYDDNMLLADRLFDLGFDASVGFEQTLLFTNGGSLETGGSLSLGSSATFWTRDYPANLELTGRTSGFMLEGFVGPLSLWGGADFEWLVNQDVDFVPTLGIRVEFNLPLDKPSTNI